MCLLSNSDRIGPFPREVRALSQDASAQIGATGCRLEANGGTGGVGAIRPPTPP
jgi:hypothetical protein